MSKTFGLEHTLSLPDIEEQDFSTSKFWSRDWQLTGLYLVTWLMELGVGIARLWKFQVVTVVALAVFTAVWWILFGFEHYMETGHQLPRWFALLWIVGPLAAATQALWLVGRSLVAWLNPRADVNSFAVELLGAEEKHPPESYQAQITLTVHEIERKAQRPLKMPSRYRIIISPVPNSYLVGRTVCITTGAFAKDNMLADMLIAREIGQLQSNVGLVTWALWLFSEKPLWRRGIIFGFKPVGSLSGNPQALKSINATETLARWQLEDRLIEMSKEYGGIGVHRMMDHWARWYRQQSYKSDQMVVELGYKDKLVNYLKQHQAMDVPEPYMFRFRPSYAQRLEALEPDTAFVEHVLRATAKL